MLEMDLLLIYLVLTNHNFCRLSTLEGQLARLAKDLHGVVAEIVELVGRATLRGLSQGVEVVWSCDKLLFLLII